MRNFQRCTRRAVEPHGAGGVTVGSLETRGPPSDNMADQTSLRFIGFAFGAVTAAVTFMAAIAIMNVERGNPSSPTVVLATSTG